MDMGTLFTKIAPYLAHPLTLVGFVLLLFFGIHRLLVTSKVIPPLKPSEGSKVVHTLLRYGFVIALVVILLGFALPFWQSKGNPPISMNSREERLVKELGITQAALESFFKILERNSVLPGELDNTLREYAKHFKDSQVQLARLSSDDSGVLALKDKAQIALKQGDYERTEELLKKVIARDIEAVQEMQHNAKQRLLSAAAFTASVGDVQSTQLDYVRAADYYRQAAELTPPDEELISANYLSRQGQSLFKAGDYNGAQSLLKQALEIREKKLGQEHSDTAQSLNDLAKILQAQGQYREAESLYHRALAIRRKVLGSEHPDIAESLNDLGRVLKDQTRYNDAEKFFSDALAIRERVLGFAHPDTAISLNNLADVLQAQGRFSEVEPLLQGAVASAQQAEAPINLLIFSRNLGSFLAKRGRFKEALSYYNITINTLNQLFAYTRGIPEKIRYDLLEQYAHYYRECIALLLTLHEQDAQAGYDQQILEVASRKQSPIFSELLRQADVRNKFATEPDFVTLKNRREALNQKLINLREERATLPITAARSDARLVQLNQQIGQVQTDLTMVEQQLRRDYPRFMELIEPQPVTVEQLQKHLLRPGEVLLNFVLLPERVVVLAIDRQRFTLRTTPLTEQELTNRVRQVRQVMEQSAQGINTDRSTSLDPMVLYRLYQDLIAPVEDSLRSAVQVLVVADGALYNLPLELLVTAYGETEQRDFRQAWQRADGSAKQPLLGEYATLSYLADRYRFSYLPSLAALVSQRVYPKSPPATIKYTLVAFADPLVPEGIMPRLPDTAAEVTSVAANLPPGASQQLYLGEQAQEHIVKQLDLSSVQYLLFATHSLLTDEFLKARQYTTSPRQNTPILQGQPAIMLTPTKGLQGGNDFLEDGFLTAAEIMELNLNAELVVLSGGTTAGKTPAAYSSEGFIGLTRAFLYAGARRLLVSHWKMETTATRDLVVAMFQELRNQKTPQEALTIAQEKLRKGTFIAGGKLYVSRAHPFFWAPFVVVGD